MISDNSIDEVKEAADLVEVIGEYVTLKKRGANYEGPCPFHDEKTPSFKVSPAKGLFKCYGCQVGGKDAFKFLMLKESLTFPEAVRKLADKYNITLQETEESPDRKEQALKRDGFVKLNQACAKRFKEELMKTIEVMALPAVELMDNRQLTPETLALFEIGFSVPELHKLIIEHGLYEAGIELGLIGTTDGRNWDMFNNRIMFPIHNERGEILGFGGRKMPDDKDTPKYLNSKDSVLYKKDTILYGLYQAKEAIKKAGYAAIVEGYYDVCSFHQTGMQNTVAPCGTALTDGHCKLLKKYTSHIVLIGDGDGAGMKANLKAVDLLLKHNFKVEICPLPKDHDPDSFAREFAYVEEEDNG